MRAAASAGCSMHACHLVDAVFVQHWHARAGLSALRLAIAKQSLMSGPSAAPFDADRPRHRSPPARETDSRAGRPLHQCFIDCKPYLIALEGVLAIENQSWNQYSPLVVLRL